MSDIPDDAPVPQEAPPAPGSPPPPGATQPSGRSGGSLPQTAPTPDADREPAYPATPPASGLAA